MKKKILIVILLLFLINIPVVNADKQENQDEKDKNIVTQNSGRPVNSGFGGPVPEAKEIALEQYDNALKNQTNVYNQYNINDGGEAWSNIGHIQYEIATNEVNSAKNTVDMTQNFQLYAETAALETQKEGWNSQRLNGDTEKDAFINNQVAPIQQKIDENKQKQKEQLDDAYEDYKERHKEPEPEDWIIYMDGAVSCGQLQDLWDLAKSYFETIKAVVIAGLVGLSLLDFTAAVFASDPSEKQKKAFKNLTIRVVIFVILIVLPELINIVITQLMPGTETCITSFI